LIGRDGRIGIATRYGLEFSGFEPWWRQEGLFHFRSERPWSPRSLLYNGYRRSFQGESGRDLPLFIHPHLGPIHWYVAGWPLPLSFTWLFGKKFVFVGYRRVESRIVGITLDDGVFDRMEMALTEVLCVRGIQAMSLK